MLQAPTEAPQPGDSCCSPSSGGGGGVQRALSPLEKTFDGVRDVNVSVALMEDFMRCGCGAPKPIFLASKSCFHMKDSMRFGCGALNPKPFVKIARGAHGGLPLGRLRSPKP